MKLSNTQKLALSKLAALPNEWLCAYQLQESISTLRSLCKKGCAESRSGLGSMFSPRTGIEFRITANGSAFVHTLRRGL